MEFIDLKTQYQHIRDQVHERIDRVLSHGQYIMGEEVTELEGRLSDLVEVKHAITVSSGTDALLLALLALGVGPGDEVITTPFSFIATVEAILLLGAKPVFVDIDARTYNIDPALIAVAITPRTKVIMPVNLFGQCADYDVINEIAERHGISVVEDAAQSFGSKYKTRYSCGLATIGCTSFYPSKPLGTYGEGGACFTHDEELAHKLKLLRVHGEEKRYHHLLMGMNARLDSIQAAILLVKLEIFPQEIDKRMTIAHHYAGLLNNIVQTPYIEAHNESVFAQYTIEVDQRDEVQAFLRRNNIPTAVHYPKTIPGQAAYLSVETKIGKFPVAERAASRVLSLPMHPYLTVADQESVRDALRQCNMGKAA
ncbi:MAG: DegT/DnrJ/EryC1/StrS family aminotransferase [Gammaproteobacteria bacterium]